MKASRNDEFDRWYRTSYPRVFAALLVVCGDSSLAEDAAHSAFVRALEKWDSVRNMGSPVGWTLQVGVNTAKRSFLRRAKGRELELSADSVLSSTDRYTDHELWQEVQKLPPRQRRAIVLRYVEGLSQSEIASVLEVAPGTAGATLNQARSSLRASLNPEGEIS